MRSWLIFVGLLSACGNASPRPPVPVPPSEAPTRSDTPPASSTAPSVTSAAPTTPAAPAPAPALPACPAPARGTPVSFVLGGGPAKLQLATGDATLAPSLHAVQRRIDDWASDIRSQTEEAARNFPEYWPPPGDPVVFLSCEVLRNDGVLLSIRCSGSDMAPRPNIHEDVFTWRHHAGALKPVTPRDLLPEAEDDVYAALEPICKGMMRPDASDRVPGLMAPLASGLHIAPYGGRRHNGDCDASYQALGALTGCGPLGYLARPATTTAKASNAGPLGQALVEDQRENAELDILFSEVWPRFEATTAAQQPFVDTLNRDLEGWISKQEELSTKPTQSNNHATCEVTTSTSELVSVRCHRGTTGSGDRAVAQTSFTRRLEDGSEVTVKDLFAVRPAMVNKLAQRCARKAEQAVVTKGMSLADFSTFGLTKTTVHFRVAYALQRDERETWAMDCEVPLKSLGVSQASLAKPRR